MFWKKKQTEAQSEDALFTYYTDDRRSAYRVKPAPEAPVVLDFEGMAVALHDISAVGVSLKHSRLARHETYAVLLVLPGRGMMIDCDIYVVDIDAAGIVHCCFKSMDDDDVESIHRYVLERQKQLLRRSKEMRQRGLE